MIDVIRDYLFKRHFRRLKIKGSEDNRQGVNYLSSITILAQSPFHSVSEIEEVISFFEKKEILCQGYLVSTDTKEVIESEEVDIITKDDTEWYGVPKKDLLIKWLSYRSDLLITLNPEHSALLRYLCAASNCRLKAAIDYGNKKEYAVDFYLQLDRVETRSLKELCYLIYRELKNVS